jgi:hypothetical protein
VQGARDPVDPALLRRDGGHSTITGTALPRIKANSIAG